MATTRLRANFPGDPVDGFGLDGLEVAARRNFILLDVDEGRVGKEDLLRHPLLEDDLRRHGDRVAVGPGLAGEGDRVRGKGQDLALEHGVRLLRRCGEGDPSPGDHFLDHRLGQF